MPIPEPDSANGGTSLQRPVPPDEVGSDPVIPSTHDVQRGEVKAGLIGAVGEKLLSQDRVDELICGPGRC